MAFDQVEYTKLKAARKRVVKAGDNQAIIAECVRALARFDTIGWPDDWSDWQRAKDDAETASKYNFS